MKLKFALLIALLLIFTGCQPAAVDKTVSFVDDLGREFELPATITRVAPSGKPAQILLYTLAPDKLVGWSSAPSDAQRPYIPESYVDLPAFGAIYGKKINLNVEAMMAAKPQVIVDFGERKQGIIENLNRLQQKIGVPIVFIEGDVETMAGAYRRLGELLGDTKRAETLAKFCESTIEYVNEKSSQVKQVKKVYYGEGRQGFDALVVGNVHSRVIALIGATNVADVKGTNGGGGNLVDLERLLAWQPDILIFNGQAAYQFALADAGYQQLKATSYQVPTALYNWMSRPPSINQLMGIYWLGHIVYPDVYDADLNGKVKEFYQLFFNYTMSDDEINQLLNK